MSLELDKAEWLKDIMEGSSYKLVTMPNIKSHRGRQRKVWSRIINGLFVSLELDKAEWRILWR